MKYKNIVLCVFLLGFTTLFAQKPYEGPYLEALVKYKFRIGKEKDNPGWGLGFRIDTAERRYVVIANDGWFTKSEFYYDSLGYTTKEISLQLSTGAKHIYNYMYEWHGNDTLQSIRSDYALTTRYIYHQKLVQAVEKIYYGSYCKIINEKPVSPEEEITTNTTCFERIYFYYDTAKNITGRRFSYYYSQFEGMPKREYLEEYHRNSKRQIDTVLIGDDGKYIIMAFEYGKKNRIKRASRRQPGGEELEIWEFKYQHNGLLKKVTYNDFPGKSWVDKYRWKRHKWKQKYPVIPGLQKFIETYDLKLTDDFYFGY